MRFTYETETNNNGTPFTTIKETAGMFAGYTVEQVSKVAENLYPNYQSYNMSNIFSDIYFNYCVRKALEGKEVSKDYSKEIFSDMYLSNKIKKNFIILENEEDFV